MTAVVLAVGFAGAAALGALLRWWAGVSAFRRWRDHLPLPTLTVNLVGSFVLGWLAGRGVSSETATMVGSGFLGTFTTFSTFVRDGHGLVVAGDRSKALVYAGLSVGGGVAAALVGLALG